jgi:zinc D-Ala-D-Ala carboxypeptidase
MNKWKYFDPAVDIKMTCSCGCGRMELKDEFMQKIVRMREIVDEPFFVVSGFRCPNHNNAVSKTGFRGPHTTGRAMDIATTGSRMRYKIFEAAMKVKINRIGIAKTFVHVDDLTFFDGFDEEVLWPY